jgi:O-antigen/teichoic acid export membrane protein
MIPIIFYFKGPIEAGRMGVTFSIIMTISFFSQSWLISKTPIFGYMAANKKNKELNSSFRKLVMDVTKIYLILAILFLIFIILINSSNLNISERFLGSLPSLCLIIAFLFSTLAACCNEYNRIHKSESLSHINVLSGFLTLLFILIYAKEYSIMLVCLSFMIVTVLTSLFVFYSLRLKYKKLLYI